MHTFDGIFTRLIFPVLLLLSAFVFLACDDGALVGSRLSPDDIQVNADTVLLDDLSIVSTPAYSGNRTYITAGEVEDPVFGTFKTTALFRPSSTPEVGSDSLVEHATLVLSLNVESIYGPAGASADFNIVEIENRDPRWRGSSWRYDSIPDLTGNIIGSFTVTDSDSLNIALDEDWARKYRDVLLETSSEARDSMFRADIPGLAIVKASSGDKMFSVEANRARFVFIEERAGTGNGENGEEEFQHLVKGLSTWAVTLESELLDEASWAPGMLINNTRTRMLEIDIPFTEEFLGTDNFSRVELVLYEDPQASPPSGFLRPRSETMRLFYLDPEDLHYAITAEPRLQVNQREEDGSYRVNITNLVNERLHLSSSTNKLYAVVGSNDGRILPVVLNGPGASGRQPKLLITGVSKE